MEVVGLGSLNMDRIILVNEVLKEGESIINEERECPGGSAANTVFALSLHGIRCGFIGAVGDDEDGERIIADLKKVGVDTQRIKVKKGEKTGKAFCFVDEKGRKVIYINVGANIALQEEDIEMDYINSASLLHMSALKGRVSLHEYVVRNLDENVKLSFAPGPVFSKMGFESLSSILKRVELLFLNDKELKDLTGEEELEEGVKKIERLGPKIIAVTAGERGARVWCGGEILEVKQREKVEVKDTTGAGDAFCAGFLLGYLKGEELRECIEKGNALAALCVSEIGGRISKKCFHS